MCSNVLVPQLNENRKCGKGNKLWEHSSMESKAEGCTYFPHIPFAKLGKLKHEISRKPLEIPWQLRIDTIRHCNHAWRKSIYRASRLERVELKSTGSRILHFCPWLPLRLLLSSTVSNSWETFIVFFVNYFPSSPPDNCNPRPTFAFLSTTLKRLFTYNYTYS